MTARRGWLLAGGAVAVVAWLGWWLAPGGAAAVLGTVALCVWLAFTLPVALWRLWRWVTYRVGVRLFLSYLLLGVTPFLFGFATAVIALWMLMGQYTSVRVGLDVRQFIDRLRPVTDRVLGTLASDGRGAAVDELEALRTRPPAPWPVLEWIVEDADGLASSPGLSLERIAWPTDDEVARLVVSDDQVFGMSIAQRGDHRVALLVPLDRRTGTSLGRDRWYQVTFVGGDTDGVDQEEVELSATADREGANVTMEAGDLQATDLFGEWSAPSDALWDRPWVVWLRQPVGVRDLRTGEEVSDPGVIMLMRTSSRQVWDDFVLSRPEISDLLRGVIIAVVAFFALLYVVALAIAGSMIVSITRATTRLTRGAGLVAAGDLDHRIPVKRHDQLGDLSASFNTMTASVQSMLSEVREKERLARELELAREIQRSLLPEPALRHGPVTLYAAFRPATEVGGDYFDLFPLGEERLLVTIGDVAGHGLSTGLLMASLKALLAALADEGYRGVELIERLNNVYRSQRPERTIATLAVADIDLAAGRIEVTNAGHPPAILVDADGRITEVGHGSIPLGSPLCRPSRAVAEFGSGSRLVLYSDGVVEAPDSTGEPFGYERLADVLRSSAAAGPEAVISSVLSAVESHHGSPQPVDDVTILVVDHRGSQLPGD